MKPQLNFRSDVSFEFKKVENCGFETKSSLIGSFIPDHLGLLIHRHQVVVDLEVDLHHHQLSFAFAHLLKM